MHDEKNADHAVRRYRRKLKTTQLVPGSGKFPEVSEQEGIQLCAALGFADPPFALSLGCDTRDLMWRIFKHPPDPRPSSIPKQLRNLLKRIRGPNFRAEQIPRALWPYIGVEDFSQLEILCASPVVLGEAISRSIETTDLDAEVILSRQGGRFRDPRTDTSVLHLAQLYRQYTKRRPTLTFAPDTGNMESPFAKYVYEAFSQFYPGKTPEGSLQLAIRQTVGFERETSCTSLEETDRLLFEPQSD